jgi:hypothetical protein
VLRKQVVKVNENFRDLSSYVSCSCCGLDNTFTVAPDLSSSASLSIVTPDKLS